MPPQFEFAENDLKALHEHIEAVEEFLSHPRVGEILTQIDVTELWECLDNALLSLDNYEKQLERARKAKP